MQHVEGQDVAELIKTGRDVLPIGRTIEIITDVAKALDFAHQNGLLHGDVKPANILVAPPVDRHSREMALLTDFGIARATATVDQQLTLPGSVIGTAAYSAPEQLAGGPIDHRVDVYALGCTLAEMLTGSKPFPNDSMATAIHAHLTAPPPRPSLMRTSLPPGIDQVIAHALAKDPAARYHSCHELAEDAARALRPPAAATPAPFQAAPPPPPRPSGHRGLLIAGGVIAVIAVIGASVAIVLSQSDSDSNASGQTTSTTGTTTSKTTSAVPAGRTAKAADGTFTVALPDGWRADKPDRLLKLTAKDGTANIIVGRNSPAEVGATLQESAEISAKQITDLLNGAIDPGGIESTTVDGEPARRYTYNLPVSEQIPRPARGRQLFVRHDGIEYLITFTGAPEAFNLAVADYEEIIDSWKWSD